MTRLKAILAGLILSLLSLSASAMSVDMCAGGTGASFTLRCYFAHSPGDYLDWDSMHMRCMLESDGTPNFYYIHYLYSPFDSPPVAHNFTQHIAVNCNPSVYRWKAWFMHLDIDGVGPLEVKTDQRSGPIPGCGPPP